MPSFTPYAVAIASAAISSPAWAGYQGSYALVAAGVEAREDLPDQRYALVAIPHAVAAARLNWTADAAGAWSLTGASLRMESEGPSMIPALLDREGQVFYFVPSEYRGDWSGEDARHQADLLAGAGVNLPDKRIARYQLGPYLASGFVGEIGEGWGPAVQGGAVAGIRISEGWSLQGRVAATGALFGSQDVAGGWRGRARITGALGPIMANVAYDHYEGSLYGASEVRRSVSGDVGLAW